MLFDIAVVGIPLHLDIIEGSVDAATTLLKLEANPQNITSFGEATLQSFRITSPTN